MKMDEWKKLKGLENEKPKHVLILITSVVFLLVGAVIFINSLKEGTISFKNLGFLLAGIIGFAYYFTKSG